MTLRPLLPLLLIVLAGAASAQPAAPTRLPVDRPVTVGGYEVACTGIGQTRQDLRWTAYGVRVEFSNAKQEYLVGAAVEVQDTHGKSPLSVSCDAPWVLIKLPAGDYRLFGRLVDSPAKPRSAAIHAPAKGQTRFVLQFPDA